MQFAILCYDNEDVVAGWSKEKDDAVMQQLGAVQEKLATAGKLGPVGRLGSTKSARTMRKGDKPVTLDGPFAETKEQLLGFYVVEAADMEEALEAARDLARASGSAGAFEVRPLTYFRANGPLGK